MGNRAVITTHENLKQVGVYVHWNGGPESVLAVLAVCRARRYRSRDYGMARFIGVWHELFGETNASSLGVDIAEELSCHNGDNGTYIIDLETWTITKRLFTNNFTPNPTALTYSDLPPAQQNRFYEIVNHFVQKDHAQGVRKAA